MISTHPDADHVGGLYGVINVFKVENIFAPKVSHMTQAYADFLLVVKNKKLVIKTAKVGVALPLTDKSINAKFVAPVKEYSKSDPTKNF